MLKFLIPALFFLVMANGRITVPITRRYVSDSAMNDIRTDTAQSFLLAASSDPQKLNVTIQNSRNLIYFAKLYVGKNTTFEVLLDTGSIDLWLPTTDCVDCPAKTKYVCNASSTCKMTTIPYTIKYGLGYVAGSAGFEMVGFTPDFQVNYTLLWVKEGKDLEAYKDTDGFIGLGNMEASNDYIDRAYKNNYIQEKVFSLYLDHNADIGSYSNSSYLAIGYIPEDKVNKLTWIPVTSANRWSTTALSMKIGDISVDISSDSTAKEILFDSGASLLLLSGAVVKELTNQLKNFDQINIGANIFYRCDAEYLEKYPNMTVTVKNMEIVLNVYTYLYFSNPSKLLGTNYCELIAKESWMGFSLFGDAFLKNNFVAFSKRNQSIGIYQEYRPIVLPKAPNQIWLVLVALVVVVIGAVFVCKKKQKNVSDLKQALNQEQNDVYSSRVES